MTEDTGRRLIVCCDGTNNTLTAGQKDTNVLRLCNHVKQVANPAHILYYDPGVGSPDSVPPTGLLDWAKRFAERIGGLASGQGIYANIAEAYLFLMHHWRGPQDRIYLFGFSRGAFTARAVAGMVNLFGLLRPEHEPLLPTLIHVYFSQPSNTGNLWTRAVGRLHASSARPGKAAAEVAGHTEASVVGGRLVPGREGLAEQIKALFVGPQRFADVHWVGVWDTVESVGLPGPLSKSNPASATLAGKRMLNVRHALSLDEHRWAFEPRIYEEPGDMSGKQTLKQRWFPGVHCDIGGSYTQDEAGISNRALDWMLAELSTDLQIPPSAKLQTAHLVRHDPLYDTPWWALAGMSLRNVAPVIAGGRKFKAIEDDGGSVTAPSSSVWTTRRSWKTLLIAVILGAIFLILSGACALGPHEASNYEPMRAASAAIELARTQALGVPSFDRYLAGWHLAPGAPAWSMVWDLFFILCIGYLLARVASRAYAWLAGRRRANSKLPQWRILGFAPLVAIGADVLEDLLTLLSLAVHGMGGDLLAYALLWLIAACSVAKIVGWIMCVPLLLVRIAIPFSSRKY